VYGDGTHGVLLLFSEATTIIERRVVACCRLQESWNRGADGAWRSGENVAVTVEG
jgi:hypothetical protein